MIVFSMDRKQYSLVRKAILAYLDSMYTMYPGPPRNSYFLEREQDMYRDYKVLQDFLMELDAREKYM